MNWKFEFEKNDRRLKPDGKEHLAKMSINAISFFHIHVTDM